MEGGSLHCGERVLRELGDGGCLSFIDGETEVERWPVSKATEL